MRRILGLDVGTTTITGLVLVPSTGQVLRQTQRLNDSALVAPMGTLGVPPTRAEQSAERVRARAMEVIAQLAAESDSIDGIAVTGQAHGLLCVGVDGQPLSPLFSWQDQRTAEDAPGTKETAWLDLIHERVKDLAWHDNGCRIAHGYGAATLFWLTSRGELPQGTVKCATIADWLAGQLVGCSPVTDPSLAASWGMYSLLGRDWNRAFLTRLNINADILPPVLPSGLRLGGLAPQWARELGLPAGLPVFNSLADTQASFLGSVSDPAGAVVLNLGTGGQICWLAPSFEQPTLAVETRPVPGRAYLRVGASLCGGAAYAWLNDTVRSWLEEFGFEVPEETVYQHLNSAACQGADTDGLSVRTTFLGSRDPAMRQAGDIAGITLSNMRLGPLARATSVGLVDELYLMYRSEVGARSRLTDLVASGGGVRKNPLVPQLIAARFGHPVRLPRKHETAALGVAALAAELDQG